MTVTHHLQNSSAFFRALGKPFRPPFVGLAPLLWGYFVCCYLFFPDSYVLRGAFIESDNYTYLAQTLDWLRGQGWFDNVQHRLGPPEGTFLHFSRFAEIPLAALTLLFRSAHLPWTGAATLAAMVFPPCLLFGLFWAARWTAECFMPTAWSRVTAYVSLFSQSLLFQFSLGHVGHRAPVAILVLLATGCVFRMMAEPELLKWGAWAGGIAALSLAMALESLPWVLALSAWVGVWLVVKGRAAARSAVLFSVTLWLGSLVLLAAYRPPAQWLDPEILSYSIVYVLLTGCVALCCGGVALAAKGRSAGLRYFVGFVLAVGSGALFLHSFPALIAGPYGAMDKALAQIFFTYIPEARPLLATVPPWIAAFSLAETLLALAVAVFFLLRAKGDERWLWALSVFLLLVAMGLTVFYQSRMFRYANLFSIVPLAVVLQRGYAAIEAHGRGWRRGGLRFGLILLVGPLLTVLIPAMLDGRPFVRGVVMYPMRDVRNACDLYPVEGLLQSPRFYGQKPLTIMNTMSTGPEILFRTFHRALAAPYHYNVKGNLDAVHFFGAEEPAEAEAIARRDHVDLVLVCKAALNIYRHEALSPRVDSKTAPVFIEQLMGGNFPPWLKKVEVPRATNFLLFEVQPAAQ